MDEAQKLRIAKRIALVVGIVVALIFCGTAFLGFVYFTNDRPAREVFMGESAE